MNVAAEEASALAPFRHRDFAVMWLAALISNVGNWMHAVGAGWLMTEISPSPLMIALVQTAATLPMFLLALPAGALADLFDKRALLLITNVCMLAAALAFAFLVWNGQATAPWLLLFTFLLGAGSAFMAPAWQAVIPKLVPRSELPQAVALGGISVNISRAIGPALAGALITFYGLAAPFAANAVSFIAIILALTWLNSKALKSDTSMPPERILSAMVAGVRYARHSAPLRATLWHTLGYMFFANAFWGLLPIIARENLRGGATFYGVLLAAVGFGAVAAAFVLPQLKKRLGPNQLVAAGTLITALMTGYFALSQSQLVAVIAGLMFGFGWILVLASVNVSAQQALPDWVRARGLALFMMVFFGSMSMGSAFWGWIAGATSISVSMLAASAGGLLFILLSYRSILQQGKDLDFSPSRHWQEPLTYAVMENDRGPVVTQIRYRVATADKEAFVQAVHKLRPVRQRHGGRNWGIYQDVANEEVLVEQFVEDSWVAHLRQHERVSVADKDLQQAVQVFHQGEDPPEVSHLLAVSGSATALT